MRTESNMRIWNMKMWNVGMWNVKLLLVGVLAVLLLYSVTAVSLNVTGVGQAGISGVASSYDNVTVTVRVNMTAAEDPSLDAGQVQYTSGSRLVPVTCAPAGTDAYSCEFLLKLKGVRSDITIPVNLFRDGDASRAWKSEPLRLSVDFTAPTLDAPVLKKDGSKVNVSVKVTDSGAKCSDIDHVTFRRDSADGPLIDELNNDPRSEMGGLVGECVLERTLQMTAIADGSMKVCAFGTDVLGLVGKSKCSESLIIDNTAPIIEEFRLVQNVPPYTVSLNTLGGGSTTAAFIRGSVLGNDTKSITVSFGALTQGLSKGSETITLLSPPSRGNKSVLQSVAVSPLAANNCTFSVTAVDQSDNVARRDFPCSLVVDRDGPLPGPISKTVFRAKDSFSIDFTEATGMRGLKELDKSGSQIAADAIIRIRDSSLSASSCVPQGSVWTCTWENVSFVDASKRIAKSIDVSTASRDSLSNYVVSPAASYPITVITSGPDVVSPAVVEYLSSDNLPVLERELVVGSQVRIMWNASKFTNAKGNFSLFGVQDLVDPECQDVGDGVAGVKSCTFIETVQDSVKTPINGKLYFTFSDNAGNVVSKEVQIGVSGIAQAKNYWTVSSVTCTPSVIDRFSASIQDYPVRCRVALARNTVSRTSGVVSPSTISMATDYELKCSGFSDTVADKITVLNGVTQSPDPVLSFKIDSDNTGNFNAAQLNITCPIAITTMVNESGKVSITTTPEIENVTMTLSFGNSPLGNQYARYYNRMDKAIDNAETLDKWVGEAQKWIDYAAQICNLRSSFTTIKNTLETATGVVGGIGDLIFPVDDGALDSVYDYGLCPGTSASSTALEQLAFGTFTDTKGVEQTNKGFDAKLTPKKGGWADKTSSFIDKMCAQVTCRGTPQTKKNSDGSPKLDANGNPQLDTSWLGDNAIGDIANKFTAFTNAAGKTIEKVLPSKQQDPTRPDIKYDAEADTKNSLLLSIAKPCIGGVVYNLNKLSMIQCEYAKCLVEDVPKKNQPSSVCTNAKNFAACKMVIGEAYTLLNMRIFDEYVAEIQKWFYQPGPKAAQFAVSGACQFACSKSAMKAPGWNWLRLTCSGAKLFLEAQTVGEQKSSLKEFTNSLKPQESSCDIEKVREQFKTLTS